MKITFRNKVQAVLWKHEITGQISDGRWENSGPRDHYEDWCNAEVEVGPDVGIDFYPRRDSYGLTDAKLLDIIGERMLRYARIATAYGREAADDLIPLLGCNDFIPKIANGVVGYWKELREKFEAVLIERSIDEGQLITNMLNTLDYSMSDLKKDLRDMSKIMKIHVR